MYEQFNLEEEINYPSEEQFINWDCKLIQNIATEKSVELLKCYKSRCLDNNGDQYWAKLLEHLKANHYLTEVMIQAFYI